MASPVKDKKPDIHKLAKSGDVLSLKNALKERGHDERVEIDDRDARGLTALQYAVLSNKPNVVRLLLFEAEKEYKKLADHTVLGEHDQTLAHYAAKTARGKTRHAPDICIEGVSEARLSSDSEVRSSGSDVRTSVSEAPNMALDGKTCLELLIIKDKESNEGETELIYAKEKINQQTPLHYAVVYGSSASVKTLLEADRNRKYDNLIHMKDYHGMTPLHLAATYNQIDIARVLITEGAHVTEVDKSNSTPLHYAASTGNIQIVDDILDSFGNEPQAEDDRIQLMSISDSGRNTCLHIAAENGHYEVVKRLVSKGASVAVSRRDKMSPLHLAVISGNDNIVKTLLESLGGYNHGADREANTTPLHLAAQHNRVAIAKLLLVKYEALSQSTLLNAMKATDRDENTALHIAAQYGNPEIIKMLMYKGADIHQRNSKGRIPLHNAAENNNLDSLKEILKPENSRGGKEFLNLKNDRQEIGRKLEKLNLELNGLDKHTESAEVTDNFNEALRVVREMLMKHGKKVEDRIPTLRIKNFVKLYGATEAFKKQLSQTKHSAESVEKGHSKKETAQKTDGLVGQEEFQKEILIKDNVDFLLRRLYIDNVVNTEDHAGNTPLHLAAKNGHSKVVKCLIVDYHAEYDRKNDQETTALHLAAQNGNNETVTVIIGRHRNAVFAEDEGCNTPLHLAARKGHQDTVDILIRSGANVNQINLDKKTPLDLAAEFGKVDICRRLVHQETQDDIHPLHLACACGHLKVVKLMLKTAADVMVKNEDGLNCLDIAIINQNKDIASYIIQSDFWVEAMKNSVPLRKGSKKINTPMRRLIRDMPDVAIDVLDRCSEKLETKQKDQTKADKKPKYNFNFEFVDDLMTPDGWSVAESKHQIMETKKLKKIASEKERENIKMESKDAHQQWAAYTTKARTLKKNHPLQIMVAFKREDLLQHRLVNKLIKTKWWNFGAYYYLLTMALHVLFLILLTKHVVQTNPPHTYSPVDIEYIMDDNCEAVSDTVLQNVPVDKYLMYILMAISACFEIVQLINMRSAYIFEPENYIDWVVYIFTFLFLLDINNCTMMTAYRQDWQWSLGAFAVFFSWISLVMYLKAFTSLGLYVIMFQLVCKTFIKVFVVFFSLILAFALGFFVLLQNQVPFRDILNSILKTSVMFLGEIDYNDLFNEGVENITSIDSTNLLYPSATSVMFSLFITLACIVLMNLLVGLAVDDIKGILRKAAFKRTAMHISLVLDVEKVLTEGMRRKFYQRRNNFQDKNDKELNCLQKFWFWILNLPFWWWNQVLEPDENAVLESIPEIASRQQRLEDKQDERLESLEKQIHTLSNMMEKQIHTLNSMVEKVSRTKTLGGK